MQLYNTLSAKEREALIEQAGEDRLTISFYKYAHIGNPKIFRNHLFIHWDELEALGRIYVAKEGVNAQLSVPADKFKSFKGVRLNIAIEQDNKSFLKLKIKVRKKIVADGLDEGSFDVTNKGIHLDAEHFNQLIDDPEAIVVDMRNHQIARQGDRNYQKQHEWQGGFPAR